jgi:hypothetical protein
MSRLGRSSIAFVEILQYVVVAFAVGGIVFAIIDEADAIWIRIVVAVFWAAIGAYSLGNIRRYRATWRRRGRHG